MVETSESELIYHIALAVDWARARELGSYTGGVSCRADGFIHFSTREQVAVTLAQFFQGRDVLVLLAAKVADLRDCLRWEEAPSGGIYPHYHGILGVAQLQLLGPIMLGSDGHHVSPLPEGCP